MQFFSNSYYFSYVWVVIYTVTGPKGKMRKLDPLYIPQLIKGTIPQQLLQGLKGDVWFDAFYQTIRETLLEAFARNKMVPATFGSISEYLNISVEVGDPPMKRETVVSTWYLRHFTDRFNPIDPVAVTRELAALTLASIIYDQVRARDGWPAIPERTYAQGPDAGALLAEMARKERWQQENLPNLTITSPTKSPISLVESMQHFQLDAPTCPNCGHVCVRNGACYQCLNCGESLGCS